MVEKPNSDFPLLLKVFGILLVACGYVWALMRFLPDLISHQPWAAIALIGLSLAAVGWFLEKAS